MRLRQIEVFYAVYTTGSISAAARTLYVSQPSVSKVLRHAEYQLGFKLFSLVRGRLVATDEAHALFQEVDDIYNRVLSLRKTVSNIKNMGGSHLRLAIVPSLGMHVAPVAIARFRDKHPEITFDVETLHHDEVFQALYERRCDFAFAYDPPIHPRMKRRSLETGQLMLMFQKQDLSDPGGAVLLELLDGRDILGLTTGGPLGKLLSAELKRQNIAITEVVSNQTFHIGAALTRCGAGMSVVDEFTARASADASTDYRPLSPAIRFKIQCVYLEDRPLSKAAEKFVSIFMTTLRDCKGKKHDGHRGKTAEAAG